MPDTEQDGADGRPSGPQRPKFLITIDVEEDNAWARRADVRTENAKAMPRFQELCDTFGLKPTYLTNYPMAKSPAFREFGRDVLRRGRGEIGMHLHAWNTPPEHRLTDNDPANHPYLIEYPEPVIRAMVGTMTDVLTEAFGERPVSHRAGRWAFNATYARVLLEYGYKIDCSVTPHVSWRGHMGDPGGRGGSDYTEFPKKAYFVDLEEISRPGPSGLLEVPMTIMRSRNRLANMLRTRFAPGSLPRRAVEKLSPELNWFRPNGTNLKQLRAVLARAVKEDRGYVELMLHSSELMPGGSPKSRTNDDMDRLYSELRELYSLAVDSFEGATLREYREAFGSR